MQDRNKWQKHEDYSRGRFNKAFKHYCKAIDHKDLYCQHDIEFTGLSGNKYIAEIKVTTDPDKSYESFTGNSILKTNKLNHLYRQHLHTDYECLFFQFYNDGILMFNLSNRFKNKVKLYKKIKRFKKYTIDESEIVDNEVVELSYNKEFGDHIFHYTIDHSAKILF